MSIRCPKCGYERSVKDSQKPDYECPACGIVYSKFKGKGNETKPNDLPLVQGEHIQKEAGSVRDKPWMHKLNSAPWIAPAVIAFVLGYFAGREHIKYEMRQTFQVAAEGVKKGLESAFGKHEPEKKRESLFSLPKQAPISISLNKKGFRAANYSEGIQDAITFTVTFKNLTEQDIRAFDGVATFTDLLDNTILSASLAINEPVTRGGQLEWQGELKFNEFISRHQNLRNEEFKNLKIRFDTKKILFSDGTVKEFD